MPSYGCRGQHAPAVAVAVDRRAAHARRRWATAGRPTLFRLTITHVPPAREHRVVVPEHRVDLVGDVEGVHHLLAGPVGVVVDHAHHRLDPPLQRRVRRVGHQLVVLDEVDPRLDQRPDQAGRLLGREADARLDDRADDRPALDAGQPSGPLDAELRAGVGLGEGGGQVEVDQLQARRTRAARTGCRRRSPSGSAASAPCSPAATTARPRPASVESGSRVPFGGRDPGRLGRSTVPAR